MSGKRALVTGGAGFIGSSVVTQLLEQSFDVTVLDKQTDPWRLRECVSDCNYLCADITQIGSKTRAELPNNVDFVFHLAAFAKPSLAEKQPKNCFSVNVFGTSVVCNLAETLEARSLVNMSALALYPNDPDYCPIDESHRLDPLQGIYAHSKWLAEMSSIAWGVRTGVNVNNIRLSNTYGPKQEAGYLIPSIIEKAQRGDFSIWNGAIVRDFNFVDDVARAITLLARSDKSMDPMNLGTGVGNSIEDLASMIAKYCNVVFEDEKRETFGPKLQIVNSNKLQHSINWKPQVNLEAGIEKTIAYFSEHGFHHE